ncbi:hypothetical protein D3C75_136130 [compost metagenome]
MSMIDSIKATYKELPKHPNEQGRELMIMPYPEAPTPHYKYTFLYHICGASFGITRLVSEWELSERVVPFSESEFIDQMMRSMRKELAESQYKITFPEDIVYTRISYYTGTTMVYNEAVTNMPLFQWHRENPYANILQTQVVDKQEYDKYVARFEK